MQTRLVPFSLLAEGLTYSAISRRVKRGALVRRFPGVYSYGPGDLSPDALWMSAVLAGGDGAVLGRLSAAGLWRASRWPERMPHVLVCRRHAPIDGIELHFTRRLEPRDVVVCRAIPVTTVARTLVDLSDMLTPHQLAYVMHQAAYHKRFSIEATGRAAERANGRHHLDVLEKAMALHLAGSAGTRSALEDEFLVVVRDLPEPLVNTDCEGEEVDFRWPGTRLVVEVDGPGHRRPAARRNDARSDAKLRAAGYTVLRFSDVEINQRSSEVLGRLPF